MRIWNVKWFNIVFGLNGTSYIFIHVFVFSLHNFANMFCNYIQEERKQCFFTCICL